MKQLCVLKGKLQEEDGIESKEGRTWRKNRKKTGVVCRYAINGGQYQTSNSCKRQWDSSKSYLIGCGSEGRVPAVDGEETKEPTGNT